jgi:hypothetical protein
MKHAPLTLPHPILLNAARSSMRLRCGSGEVRMSAPVGPFFWPLPVLAPWWLFLVFFLLNLDSTTPNYPRKPLMRSSKAPTNQKNRGQFLPEPTRTHRSWHPNLPGSRIGAASNSAPHLRVLGGVMLSVQKTWSQVNDWRPLAWQVGNIYLHNKHKAIIMASAALLICLPCLCVSIMSACATDFWRC